MQRWPNSLRSTSSKYWWSFFSLIDICLRALIVKSVLSLSIWTSLVFTQGTTASRPHLSTTSSLDVFSSEMSVCSVISESVGSSIASILKLPRTPACCHFFFFYRLISTPSSSSPPRIKKSSGKVYQSSAEGNFPKLRASVIPRS